MDIKKRYIIIFLLIFFLNYVKFNLFKTNRDRNKKIWYNCFLFIILYYSKSFRINFLPMFFAKYRTEQFIEMFDSSFKSKSVHIILLIFTFAGLSIGKIPLHQKMHLNVLFEPHCFLHSISF